MYLVALPYESTITFTSLVKVPRATRKVPCVVLRVAITLLASHFFSWIEAFSDLVAAAVLTAKLETPSANDSQRIATIPNRACADDPRAAVPEHACHA